MEALLHQGNFNKLQLLQERLRDLCIMQITICLARELTHQDITTIALTRCVFNKNSCRLEAA